MALVPASAIPAGTPSPAPAPCEPPSLLPAYSHNDYHRTRPLEAALALGYQGVEVDLHFARGRLLIGHDLEETRPERTFEAIYLDLLEKRIERCGEILPNGRPFRLFVDLKTKGMPGYRALRAALASRAPLFTTLRGELESPGPVTVVLVGWSPPLDTLRAEEIRYVGVHRAITGAAMDDAAPPAHLVRMASLDASRLPSWSGEGRAPSAWREAFGRLRAAAAGAPERITRVHHLRVNARIYAYALSQGVNLIGTEALDESRRALYLARFRID